jgi:hypothetical protein
VVAPTDDELHAVLQTVITRLMKMLTRRGVLIDWARPTWPSRMPARTRRARCGVRLLKRVFDIDMQHCPHCGAGELKIIAAIVGPPVIQKILTHLGLDHQPAPQGRAREPGPHFAA